MEVQENDQEIIEHNENKQSHSEEQVVQKILVEQGHENEQQQKTYHICSFPEDDKTLEKKAETKRYNEEEKELLMRVVKEIRYDPERIPSNLRYIDRKKVRTTTVKINKIVSLIKMKQLQKQIQYYPLLGIMLSQKQDDRKQSIKLEKKNFRETEEF